jgi:hypothetical protein
MNEFEEWFDATPYLESDEFGVIYSAAKRAYAAGREMAKRESAWRFACQADPYNQDSICVLDSGNRWECCYAEDLISRGLGKTDCRFWR